MDEKLESNPGRTRTTARERLHPKREPVSMGPSGLPFAPEFLVEAEVEQEAECARRRVLQEIDALQLTHRAQQLEMDGYTVLAPGEVADPSFVERLRDTTLRISEARSGGPVDVATGKSHARFQSPFGQVQWEPTLLIQDRIYEEALMNRAVLAL